ncbi:MAG: hypothetical protein HY011_09045 [Acidobacteria bacterium]|nr:hypothetical protein [Acidobacteriota bacterium]
MTHRIHQCSLRSFCLALFVLLALCAPSLRQRAQAQAPPAAPQYALFEYFKLEPGKGPEYRKLEQEAYVPIQRERVKQGIIKSWSVWNVRFPGGAAREYDRLTITTFDKFAAVETPYPTAIFTKVFPNTTAAELLARSRGLIRLVRSEMVTLLDSVGLNPQPLPPAPFAEISFHKVEPGKGPEYTALIGKYLKPLYEERIKRGTLNGWQRFGVRYPGGTEREYGQITLSFIAKFEHLETQNPPDLLSKVLPGVNGADVITQLNATRKTVRTQVLTLVDQVQ